MLKIFSLKSLEHHDFKLDFILCYNMLCDFIGTVLSKIFQSAPCPPPPRHCYVGIRFCPSIPSPPPPSQFPVSRYMNVESASCRNNAGSKMRLNRFDPHTFANPTFICSSGSSLCGRFAFSRHSRSYTFLYVFHYKVLK